jgi:hypothetical protein
MLNMQLNIIRYTGCPGPLNVQRRPLRHKRLVKTDLTPPRFDYVLHQSILFIFFGI